MAQVSTLGLMALPQGTYGSFAGKVESEEVSYGPHDRGVMSIWTSGRRLPVMKYYKAATLLLLMRWW